MLFGHLKIRTKLTIVLVLVGLVPLGVISWVSVSDSRTAITDLVEQGLVFARNESKTQIESFFGQQLTALNVLSRTADAMIAFRALNAYLEDWEIQPEGPYDIGHDDYETIYSAKGKVFADYVAEYGYQDLYLIHGQYGLVMYSARRGRDLGSNLATGEYRNSTLARIWRDVRDTKAAVLTDIERYQALGDEPAMFVGCPILDGNGEVLCVLAAQISQAEIDAILQRREGLGQTGEAIIVGPDRLLRSNPFNADKQAVLVQDVPENALGSAEDGQNGVHFGRSYKGTDVLLTHVPLSIEDLNWYLIVEVESDEVFASIADIQTTVAIVAAILTILVSTAGFALSRYISRSLRRIVGITGQMNSEFEGLAEIVDAVATNDLTGTVVDSDIERIVPRSNDEIGELISAIDGTLAARDRIGRAMRTMMASLSKMILDIKSNAMELVEVATNVSQSSERIATASKEQSQMVEHVSVAMEEMATIIESSTGNAQDAARLSENSSATATRGGQVVTDTISGMNRIDSAVERSSEAVVKLYDSAQQIGDIVTVINDIADQTNLLALNAAIEAARAGEQGRGFAVVADEVRKLSERTGTATSEIANMIRAIQQDTESTVHSMEAGTREVRNGQEMVDMAGRSLNEIVEMSGEVLNVISAIASASEQQSQAANEIAHNLSGITNITSGMASESEQAAGTSHELNSLASGLQQLVSTFKVTEK